MTTSDDASTMVATPLIAGYPIDLFDSAVLRVMIIAGHKRCRLAFGLVELLPREVPPLLHKRVHRGTTTSQERL